MDLGRIFHSLRHNAQRISVRPLRILFVANDPILPTLEICLVAPLSRFIGAGDIITDRFSEKDISSGSKFSQAISVERKLNTFRPDLILFCRYSGPDAPEMTKWAKKNGVVTVFHIDDDLLNIPPELGERKVKFHSAPERLATIRHLLSSVDLVYCSTETLRETMADYGGSSPIIAGALNASSEVLSSAQFRRVRKIGYMGFDHAADLQMIAPAIVQYLTEFPEISFEMFGSIQLPTEFGPIMDRVTIIPPVRGYSDFVAAFAKREWDIGICPLLPTHFNARKSELKWIEYTAVGAAVIASAGTIYDECCSNGAGSLASNNEEWLSALRSLTDPYSRFEQVVWAQEHLKDTYSRDRHSLQVLSVLAAAFEKAGVEPPDWQALSRSRFNTSDPALPRT